MQVKWLALGIILVFAAATNASPFFKPSKTFLAQLPSYANASNYSVVIMSPGMYYFQSPGAWYTSPINGVAYWGLEYRLGQYYVVKWEWEPEKALVCAKNPYFSYLSTLEPWDYTNRCN